MIIREDYELFYSIYINLAGGIFDFFIFFAYVEQAVRF